MQTANRTKELAANTLEELERQGDKLEAIDRDLHAVSSPPSFVPSRHSDPQACYGINSLIQGALCLSLQAHILMGGYFSLVSTVIALYEEDLARRACLRLHPCMQIDADVKESKGLLNYMQRCCLCFLCSCCCDCDPSVKEDKNRKSRVRQ